MARARAERWGPALAGAALGALGAACTLLTSLSGLTGGTPDGGVPDDAPSIVADSGGSAPVDDDAGDAGEDALAPPDAIDDSSPLDATDGPPSAYCASLSPQPLFCDDFDEDPSDAAALAAPWDQVTQVGGSVTRSGGIFTSPTLAMLVTTKANQSSIDLCGYKSFSSLVPSKGDALSLAFDLYVAEADTTSKSDAVLAAIELIDPLGDRWALQLEVTYDGALDVNFSENASILGDAASTYTSHPIGATLPIGAWTRVTMEVTVGPPFTATLTFGTTDVADQIAVTPHTTGGHPEILVGGTYAAESTQGWTVRYDDVVFDAPAAP